MSYTIRRFAAADRTAMIAFAHALPEHDLLFLGRDLREPRVIDAWLAAIAGGAMDSLVAHDGDTVVGSAALVRDPAGWSAHVGEIRLLVAPDRRGAGAGRDLLEAIFVIAHGRALTKLTAAMTPDQAGSIAVFEHLGFTREALLRDQVRDHAGAFHDLAILSKVAVPSAAGAA